MVPVHGVSHFTGFGRVPIIAVDSFRDSSVPPGFGSDDEEVGVALWPFGHLAGVSSLPLQRIDSVLHVLCPRSPYSSLLSKEGFDIG